LSQSQNYSERIACRAQWAIANTAQRKGYCIVNHRTSDADIDDVTREVLSAARDLI
jgi:hypothetical protein